MAAGFGPAPGGGAVAQLVPAGHYVTTKRGHLRDEAKAVLADVVPGTPAVVDRAARTSRFSLGTFSLAKDHTWVQCLNREGWLRDALLSPAAPPAREQAAAATPPRQPEERLVARPASSARSAPLAIGGRAPRGGAAATTTVDELDAYRDAEDAELEAPGVAKGANPLGLGRPFERVNPADYRITIRDGSLYERTGAGLLTVIPSPFVLSAGGQLFGGQGETAADRFSAVMQSHAQAEVGSPAWAGELAAADGRVTYINNQSGTYMLHDRANVNIVKFLYRHRVLGAEQMPDLKVERVYKPGQDRDGKLERHALLG
jgi:hypothetical protein